MEEHTEKVVKVFNISLRNVDSYSGTQMGQSFDFLSEVCFW